MRRVVILTLMAVMCWASVVVAQDVKGATDAKCAKLKFDKESHDFGQVLRSEGDVSVEFHFTNEGTLPLVIKRATTTCSCTDVNFSKRPVMPGQGGVIEVVYSPSKLPAETFHKAIKVFSNDPQGMTIITIHGESVD